MTYAADAIAQINRVTTQAELSALGDLVTAAINAQIAAVTAQAAAVAPIAALASASVTDLPSVLSFLGNLKTALLGPAVVSAASLAAQAPLLAADLTAVAAAIAAAEARIGG